MDQCFMAKTIPLDTLEDDNSTSVQETDQSGVVLATAGYDHTIKFWGPFSGTCFRTIRHPASQVNRLAISLNKQYLAAAGNPHVRIYDCRSQKESPLLSFEEHTSNVTGIAFHRKAAWTATSSEDGTVKIWDLRCPHAQKDYNHGCAVNDVVIHPNQDEVISCDQGGCVKIWDLRENVNTHTLIPEEDVPARSVAVANDGRMLIAGNNKGDIYVWEMESNPEDTKAIPRTRVKAHDTYITQCIISPDGKYLGTCSADKTARIWSIDCNIVTLDKTLEGHQRWVWDCAFSADSAYILTASSDHVVRLWELSSGTVKREYLGHSKGVVALALNDFVHSSQHMM